MTSNAPPTVTLSLFGFRGAAKAWAFAQMGLARRHLSGVEGLRFSKQLGSGNGAGFSLRPNWARYGFLSVWESEEDAGAFLSRSDFMTAYRERADEIWTARLVPVAAHGAWSGVNPFLPLAPKPEGGPVAALTRATVRWRRLAAFWRAVPDTSDAILRAEGRIASIGVGEAPFVRQATFSLWRSAAEMQQFAYRDAAHAAAIRRTRDEGWYSEELFARFVPVASEGKWDGRDPLEGLV